MYRIAILGCENSHANNFLRLISEGHYPEITAVGVYSNEPEASKKLHDTYGVPVMENYDSLVGQVDGIMITARDGANHYPYAKPYLSSGIPMFIDKPITRDGAEAVDFMREAKKNGVRLCGGSVCATLKETLDLVSAVESGELGAIEGGNICCPIAMTSVYGGFYFYAQHLVQTMMRVFGNDVLEVNATMRDTTAALIAKYRDYDVTANYTAKGYYYHVSVFGEKGVKSEQLNFTSDSFFSEMNDMRDLLCGKEMKTDYDTFIRPVFVMDALVRSAKSGKWEKVEVESV